MFPSFVRLATSVTMSGVVLAACRNGVDAAPTPNAQEPAQSASQSFETPRNPSLRDHSPEPTLDAFRDGARHYQKATDTKHYPRYEPAQVSEIAENLILHQRSNGGWPANWDPQRILSDLERQRVLGERDRADTTLDNQATYPAVEYLVAAASRLGEARYLESAKRGLEFILMAQYDNGGFPHSYPDSEGHRGHVTFLDAVVPGVLTTLRKVHAAKPPYDALDPRLRERAGEAVRRGDACILRTQVRIGGTPTAWAGQYDRVTLLPTLGRTFELPGLVSRESVDVVRYLMSIDPPSPETTAAVQAAASWLERSKLHGIRIEEFEAPPVRWEYHQSHTDRRLVEDASAPPIWARFYELETNRPFMANRDGTKVYELAQVTRERRTGYEWYGYFARELLEREYPAWKRRLGLD